MRIALDGAGRHSCRVRRAATMLAVGLQGCMLGIPFQQWLRCTRPRYVRIQVDCTAMGATARASGAIQQGDESKSEGGVLC
jgi:hypothetical protein